VLLFNLLRLKIAVADDADGSCGDSFCLSSALVEDEMI